MTLYLMYIIYRNVLLSLHEKKERKEEFLMSSLLYKVLEC